VPFFFQPLLFIVGPEGENLFNFKNEKKLKTKALISLLIFIVVKGKKKKRKLVLFSVKIFGCSSDGAVD